MTARQASPLDALQERRRVFGREVLGPIFFTYAHRLRLHLQGLQAQHPTGLALFCARGGLRLRLLYDLYCSKLGIESPWPARDFYVSRIAAVRAGLAADYPTARGLFVSALPDASERQLLAALLAGSRHAADDFLPQHPRGPEPLCDVGLVLDRLRDGAHPAADAVMTHTADQHRLFHAYTAGLMGDSGAIALCDSGLRCTVQIVLSQMFSDREWFGLLLGCLRRAAAAEHYPRLYGMLFDIDFHRDASRRSTFIRHWELVEHVLEPRTATTSFYEPDPSESTRVTSDAMRGYSATSIAEGNPFFSGVLEYFEHEGPDSVTARSGRVYAAYETALTRLDRAFAFPSSRDVEMLNVINHDPGFGMTYTYTSATAAASPTCLSDKIARVQASPWPHGQARLEFGRWAPVVQAALYRPKIVVRAASILGGCVHGLQLLAARAAVVTRQAVGCLVPRRVPDSSAVAESATCRHPAP